MGQTNRFKYLFNVFLIQIVAIGFSLQAFAAAKSKNAVIEKYSFENDFYYQTAQTALKQFQLDSFKNADLDIDVIFIKIEKRIIYQNLKKDQVGYFDFQNLTNSVIHFIGKVKNNYRLPVDFKQRSQYQMMFYGLSQAIKKANEMNLTIQSEQFDKLHDILMSQSTNLFYASYKEARRSDLFWNAYFLHELNYPMDLTAKHLSALDKKINKMNDPSKFKIYGAKLAKLALTVSDTLSKPNQEQIDTLYSWAKNTDLSEVELSSIQKAYLKQLQLIGDSERVKDFKKELANNLLVRETKEVFRHPFGVFKYIQFLIGYIFVAWPLEVILVIFSLGIFSYQSGSVLTKEEKRRAKRIDKRLWMMFTKAYLGSNVPFFSKLAASLILFGVGLYFNSARNFVESLIASL